MRTRARREPLPEIWSTYPAVGEKDQALKDAAAALAEVAGDGLDALRSKIGAVGKACKGCHDDFPRGEDVDGAARNGRSDRNDARLRGFHTGDEAGVRNRGFRVRWGRIREHSESMERPRGQTVSGRHG